MSNTPTPPTTTAPSRKLAELSPVKPLQPGYGDLYALFPALAGQKPTPPFMPCSFG